MPVIYLFLIFCIFSLDAETLWFEDTQPPLNTSNWVVVSEELTMIINNSSLCPEYSGPFNCWSLCASNTGSPSYFYRITPINHEDVVVGIDARAINVVNGASCKYFYNVNTFNDENWFEYNSFDGVDNRAVNSAHFISDVDGTHFSIGVKFEIEGTTSSACCTFTDIYLTANALPTQQPTTYSPTISLNPTIRTTIQPSTAPSNHLTIVSNFTLTIDILSNNSNISNTISDIIENLDVYENYELIVDNIYMNGTILTVNIIVNSINGDIVDIDDNELIIATQNALQTIYGDKIIIFNDISTTHFVYIISTTSYNGNDLNIDSNNSNLTWLYVVIIVIIILIIIVGILYYYKYKLQKSVVSVNKDDKITIARVGSNSNLNEGHSPNSRNVLNIKLTMNVMNTDDGENERDINENITTGDIDGDDDNDSEKLYGENDDIDGEMINNNSVNDSDDMYDEENILMKETTTGGKYNTQGK